MGDPGEERVAKEIDAKAGSRWLVIEIAADGSLQCDPDADGISPYELPGIGCWIESLGHKALAEDEEDDDPS